MGKDKKHISLYISSELADELREYVKSLGGHLGQNAIICEAIIQYLKSKRNGNGNGKPAVGGGLSN